MIEPKTIKYKIWTDLNLIYEYFSGPLNVDDMINFKKQVANDADYLPTLNVIEDFRKAELNISVKDLSKYIEFFNTYTKIYGKRKSVHLTAKPKEVAVSMLFDVHKGKIPIHPLVCSTLEKALNWVDISQHNFEDVIFRIKLFLKEIEAQ